MPGATWLGVDKLLLELMNQQLLSVSNPDSAVRRIGADRCGCSSSGNSGSSVWWHSAFTSSPGWHLWLMAWQKAPSQSRARAEPSQLECYPHYLCLPSQVIPSTFIIPRFRDIVESVPGQNQNRTESIWVYIVSCSLLTEGEECTLLDDCKCRTKFGKQFVMRRRAKSLPTII